jgi:hypothetical protein
MTERRRRPPGREPAGTVSLSNRREEALAKARMSLLSLTGKHLSSNNRDLADVAAPEDENSHVRDR